MPLSGSMRVALRGEVLTISAPLEETHELTYEFRHCMANGLYTFGKVAVDSVTVNEATSDNIGPFLIAGRGWTGGNHLLADGKTRSAHTLSVEISVGGVPLRRDTSFRAERVDISVTNRLLDPLTPDSTFCIEKIDYTVCGNSIQVEAVHEFRNPEAFVVDRYYGMQSMMKGETAILTPGGRYGRWTPVGCVGRFTRKSAPLFRQFIERSEVCHMAAYLCEDGLGDRRAVGADDVVFIGNSWTKSYHKLMGGATVRAGDVTHWKGVYSWFVTPEKDEPGEFSYSGFLDGQKTVFSSKDGRADRTEAVGK